MKRKQLIIRARHNLMAAADYRRQLKSGRTRSGYDGVLEGMWLICMSKARAAITQIAEGGR